jgi:catechol 2,3-dioxygenase
LFSDRYELACTLNRLLQRGWPLQGSADHGVSEAIYLADPEGNGIELYVDRPKAEWPMKNGKLAMVSEPLSLRSILDELNDCSKQEMDPNTRIGHIHLNVSDLQTTRQFYSTLVGMDVMEDDFPGALFMSAGGYHHHIGANVWNGRNAPPPPSEAAGLLSYTLQVLDDQALQSIRTRLIASGASVEDESGGFSALDPSQIRVRFSSSLA